MNQQQYDSLPDSLKYRTDLPQLTLIARAYAHGLRSDLGIDLLTNIDIFNASYPTNECGAHSHCDPNEYMDDAFEKITGTSISSILPDVDDATNSKWSAAFDLARHLGLSELSKVKGYPDDPSPGVVTQLKSNDTELTATLPGTGPEEQPLGVTIDYWGRNPRLQLCCTDQGDDQGEPVVSVRYDANGRVQEVGVWRDDVEVNRGGAQQTTAWEIERDVTAPPCYEGDALVCKSGRVEHCRRLQEGYVSFEEFADYSGAYGLLDRLAPDDEEKTERQVWDSNPLIVSSVYPADLQIVPEAPGYTPAAKPGMTTEKKAELYDRMLEAAKANGFGSISAAITVASGRQGSPKPERSVKKCDLPWLKRSKISPNNPHVWVLAIKDYPPGTTAFSPQHLPTTYSIVKRASMTRPRNVDAADQAVRLFREEKELMMVRSFLAGMPGVHTVVTLIEIPGKADLITAVPIQEVVDKYTKINDPT